MSRRVLTPRPVAEARAGDRMAPGGRMWSESPIRHAFQPAVKVPAVVIPPEPVFPTSEVVFSGAQVSNTGNIFFSTATFDGVPITPTGPAGAWQLLPVTGYKMELLWNSVLLLWEGAIRLSNTSAYANRFYSTLPDAAGTGAPNLTLTQIAVPVAPFSYYVNQSADPDVPSLSLSVTQVNRAYQFFAPPPIRPTAGRIPVSGVMRVSTNFGPGGPWPPPFRSQA